MATDPTSALERFGEPYLGPVVDRNGRRVERGGEPDLSNAERVRAAEWQEAWTWFYETGSTAALEDVGLLPPRDTDGEPDEDADT